MNETILGMGQRSRCQSWLVLGVSDEDLSRDCWSVKDLGGKGEILVDEQSVEEAFVSSVRA